MPERCYVYIDLGSGFVPAGLLTIHEEGEGFAEFVYGRAYLKSETPAPLDPSRPLITAPHLSPLGSPLFGAIRDAAPDAWGRHLLDTLAQTHGVRLRAIDYLMMASQNRIGALAFGPDLSGPQRMFPDWMQEERVDGEELDLAEMLQAADQVERHEELDAHHRRFLMRGSSLGGATPKAPTLWEGKHCIAKFGREKEAWNTPRIEMATMTLANACGIQTPWVTTVIIPGKRDVLLVERFDRWIAPDGALHHHHFLSAATLLGMADDATTGGTYRDIAEAMRIHCSAAHLQEDLRELFCRMVFNVACHNTDDHLRNHGFLWDGKAWRLAPAYDIAPQPIFELHQPGRLSLGVGPKGPLATFENALAGCQYFGLEHSQAAEIVERVRDTVGSWESTFKEVGVPHQDFTELRQVFKLAQSY
jgi:serine/threonine-protein kinase HipA